MPIRIRKRPGDLHWTAAGSFAAISLAQYFVDLLSNGGGGVVYPGGTGGGAYFPPIGGGSGGSTLLSRALALDGSAGGLGIIYSEDFDVDDPTWIDINGGLDATKYLIIDELFTSPVEALYVSGDILDRSYSFLARAPTIGGTFAEIWNADVAGDYFSGIVAAGSMRTQMVGCNPTQPDEIIFMGACNLGAAVFKCTAGGSIVEIPALSSLYGGSDTLLISYGAGKFLTGKNAGDTYTFLSDYSGLASLGSLGGGTHVRADATGITITPLGGGDLRIGASNLATHVDTSGLGLDWGADAVQFNYKMAIDDSGMQILTRDGSDPVISVDGGVSFLPTALPSSPMTFAFAGGTGADTRWLASGSDGLNGQVYYNQAGALGDWQIKTGNILTLNSGFTGARCLLALP